jgi:hypothetical protein
MSTKLELMEENGKVFTPLRERWLVSKPEEVVRQKFICLPVNNHRLWPEHVARDRTLIQFSFTSRFQLRTPCA